MRVLDLLALLSDYTKNTAVQLCIDGAPVNMDHFELTTVLEERRLILIPKVGGHPHKLWELRLLLGAPALRTAYVYLQEADGVRPAFGFQQRPTALVIN
ncbi:hypothetical protein [Lacticaseibacillus daqingensis]|uniref:hypothetical protein n=1 Tax=Lacticaseibacillus daqingensis TaxID=2486014 RepID=UPI000F799F91|nr:hypothetical protein [Lacticaseibacillus daqingensis]